MNDFVSIYDILESGYRGLGWFLAIAAILLATLIYLFWLKPDSSGEKIYRWVLALLWLLAFGFTATYHYRGYDAYSHYAIALRAGKTLQTTGVITNVQAEGYFLYLDVNGKRFRCSQHEWPFHLGFHPADFPLQPTFLIRVYSVNDVIVRLQIHRANLAD